LRELTSSTDSQAVATDLVEVGNISRTTRSTEAPT
jgi:hypothetical protein